MANIIHVEALCGYLSKKHEKRSCWCCVHIEAACYWSSLPPVCKRCKWNGLADHGLEDNYVERPDGRWKGYDMKDKRKFAASISIRIGDSRIKLELAPAPDYGGPEGFYRVRAARRWLDTEDGQPRFLERDGIARIAAEIALCALEPPAPAPSIPEPSRVSVRRPDGFYDGGWTNTEPILNYEGRWVIHVLLAGKSGFVPVEDVIVHKERRRG